MINQGRVSGSCQGSSLPAAPALKWNDQLYRAANDHSQDMATNRFFEGKGSDGSTAAKRLVRHGYQARAQAQYISAGSATAPDVFGQLSCDLIMSRNYTEFGASMVENPKDSFRYYWTVLLAQPMASPTPPTVNPTPPSTPVAAAAETKRVLEITNQARAQARTCGTKQMPAVPPLTWDDRLAAAAQSHSQDMVTNQFFDHRGSNGSSVGQRVRQQGYQGSAVGENISKGHSTAREVVDGWLRSPGHCNNIMSPDFSQLGVGLIGNTWTQVFAHPF